MSIILSNYLNYLIIWTFEASAAFVRFVTIFVPSAIWFECQLSNQSIV